MAERNCNCGGRIAVYYLRDYFATRYRTFTQFEAFAPERVSAAFSLRDNCSFHPCHCLKDFRVLTLKDNGFV